MGLGKEAGRQLNCRGSRQGVLAAAHFCWNTPPVATPRKRKTEDRRLASSPAGRTPQREALSPRAHWLAWQNGERGLAWILHTHTRTHARTHTHRHTHTRTRTYRHTDTDTHRPTQIHTRTHTHTRTRNTRTHAHTPHTFTHHAHTHTHTGSCLRSRPPSTATGA